MTKESEPQSDVKRYLRFLQRETGFILSNSKILDLGCGTGRNANYLAELGGEVSGLDISATAIALARERAGALNLTVHYSIGTMGSRLPYEATSFDLILDVIASNSLNEEERAVYLSEVHRVLKIGGHLFVKTLCKDGDKNAKNLLALHPGQEKDTYVIPEMDLTERVFSREDFQSLYGKYFTVLKLEKKSNYAKFRNQNYKRNYWLAYMQKNV